jgi:hypothetical protein
MSTGFATDVAVSNFGYRGLWLTKCSQMIRTLFAKVKRGKGLMIPPMLTPMNDPGIQLYQGIKGVEEAIRSIQHVYTSPLAPLAEHISPAVPTFFTEPRPFQRQW